jgi:hypothetical protein
MASNVIGHIDCPICGHEMPIKPDKNGHAYGHCAHRCNGQLFTRNDHRDGLLRARMRPVTVTDTEQAAAPAASSVSEPTAPAPAPAPVAPPAPPRRRASFFTPLLGATE